MNQVLLEDLIFGFYFQVSPNRFFAGGSANSDAPDPSISTTRCCGANSNKTQLTPPSDKHQHFFYY